MECAKCKVKDNEPFLFCDSCNCSVHRDCSNLNSSELKVMDLKGKRVLRFCCEECSMGIKLIPTLIKKINELQTQIEQLKMQNQTNQSIGSDTSISNEIIINEILERQKRMNNVMVYNLPEKRNSEEDAVEVKTLVKELTKEDLNIAKVIRVGKKNKNGHRALKVIFSSSEDAKKIIRVRKDFLKDKNIFIGEDMTSQQAEYLRRLKEEVRDRRNRGEQNVSIRYIRGIPKVQNVSKN